MRRFRIILAAGLCFLIGLGTWASVNTVLAQQGETTVLGDLLSRALSTPTSQVAIGSVDGALSSDATIRRVTVSDRDGPWLRLDRARLIWRRAALFSRRLEVERLEIGRLEILRRPQSDDKARPTSTEPLLPELPLKIDVKAFALEELVLAEPVIGTAARLSGNGQALLGPPAEGLTLKVDARRLDGVGGRASINLAFVPQGERLDVAVRHDEPAGGLVAQWANLPDRPPVQLTLAGTGVLDDWTANLTFSAGPEIGAAGNARLARQGAQDRLLTLALDARIAGLLPDVAAPIFEGATRLEGRTRFVADSSVALDRLSLVSRLARLDVSGSLTADRVIDVTAQAEALPNVGPSTTRAHEVEIGRLAFTGSAKGPLASPKVEGRLDGAELRFPEVAIGKVEAVVSSDFSAGSSDLLVTADARVAGARPKDPALARAVGETLEVSLKGLWASDGNANVETLRLLTPTLDLSYAGRLGSGLVDGLLTTDIRDLRPFSDLAQRSDLAGSARTTARLAGSPNERLQADLNGSLKGLSVGISPLDRLLSGEIVVAGGVDWLARDGIAIRDLRLKGPNFSAAAVGVAGPRQTELNLDVEIAELRTLDARLAGRARSEVRLTGSAEKLDLTGLVTADDAKALARPIRQARLSVSVADLTGRPDAGLMLTGTVGNDPLNAAARLRQGEAGALSLDGLNLTVGRARLEGSVSLDESGLAAGALTIAAPDLNVLSPLVLTDLKGELDGRLTLTRDAGQQGARLVGEGRNVTAVGLLQVAALTADLDVADLYRRPRIDGRLNAERVIVGGEAIERLSLTATGGPTASDLDLSAEGKGLNLRAGGRLATDDRPRIDLGSLRLSRGAHWISLEGPSSLRIDPGSIVLSDTRLVTSGGGRLLVSGTAGHQLGLSLAAEALPLALADIALPDLKLSGALSGELTIKGTQNRPVGAYRIKVAQLTSTDARQAGVPPLTLDAQGALDGDKASLVATAVVGKGGGRLRAEGSVPLDAGASVSIEVSGTLDAALANSVLARNGGQRLTGRVSVDARLTGDLASPRIDGAVNLRGGTFTDPVNGIALTGLEGTLLGRGDTLTVERLTATARNGGTLGARGEIRLQPDAGYPSSLRFVAQRAELASSGLATVVASFDVGIEGPLATRPRLAGRVDVVSMDITVPDRLPDTVKPLPGTRHVGAPPQVRERLASQRRSTAPGGRSGAPFAADLDLVLSAPNRVFVRGRGLDAELGGDLRLSGSTEAPDATGAFELRRGRFSLAGQRIDLRRGRVGFAGGLTPDLDFEAQTQAGEFTAQIVVSGPASQPSFTLTSQPALPQDEVLSRLLFAKAAGNLSPFQALQLAQTVAQLSGRGGSDAFDRARRALGVDSLDITTGSSGGPAVGVSRYVGDRLSVGVRAGARPEDSAATATIDVTRRLKVQGEVGADGRSSLGVGAEWEY